MLWGIDTLGHGLHVGLFPCREDSNCCQVYASNTCMIFKSVK